MDFQEEAKLRGTSEFKAADALADAHNSMGFNHEKFAMGVCMQHRTLQQNIMRSFVATIRHMASEDYGYDLRNQSSHNAAKQMVESGLLDEIYLPFVLPMYYECCCADITIEEWKRKMKGVKPINYKWLVAKIKKHLPQLYEALCLDIYNPYQEKCGVNRDYYVLVHSAIEYFIKK